MAEQDPNQTKKTAVVQNAGVAATRRDFFNRALAATTGLALSELLPAPAEAAAQTPPPATCSPAPCLIKVGEIKSSGKKLQAVIMFKNEVRTVQGAAKRVRYFEGYNPNDSTQHWPTTKGVPAPGPTLRAKVGDTVNITLLNHINVADFHETVNKGDKPLEGPPVGPGMGSDRAEQGLGCDASTAIIDGKVNKDWYPNLDKFADCFHGSNTGNLHFHGTHTNPDGLGDDVLVQLLPSPRDAKGNPVVTEASVKKLFAQIFADCPAKWDGLPKEWKDDQAKLLNQYDHTQQWMGKVGLPPDMRLLPVNENLIHKGLWPQYFIGAFPNCFTLPEYAGVGPGKPIMGQSPGTHWYHAHKHGSTALHLLNGLAGAFIIEGKYDADLRNIYPNLQEKVMVVQEFDDTPNLIRAGSGPRATLVNGQLTPTIQMQPGEIQLWRFVNAAQSLGGGNPMALQFAAPASGSPPQMRQIAQDGVQFKFENYQPQIANPPKVVLFATGNRVDLLVQAPLATGNYQFLSKTPVPPNPPTVLINVQVTGNQVNPPMNFPVSPYPAYPEFPPFLHDIDPNDVHKTRTLTFGWEKGRVKNGRSSVTNSGPIWNIDGKQFEDGVINQLMLLDSAEDWTIYNYTSVNHTFHIHINPFQLIQFNNPNLTDPDVIKQTKDFVWWDTIALPSAKVDSKGNVILDPVTQLAQTPGYVKIRQHFVDFPGTFVLHCHILGHEDRGMMQLVQVADNHTPYKHH